MGVADFKITILDKSKTSTKEPHEKHLQYRLGGPTGSGWTPVMNNKCDYLIQSPFRNHMLFPIAPRGLFSLLRFKALLFSDRSVIV